MNATQFARLLRSKGACSEARESAKGKDLETVWATCERGDWMLWLLGKMCETKGWPDRKQLVLSCCACAAKALKYVPKGENHPREAIRIARLWVRGKATIEEVRQAYAASASAASPAAAYAAAAYAAAAYAAAAYAHRLRYAAYAADNAYAVAYAASADARQKSLKESARIVRRMIPVRMLP